MILTIILRESLCDQVNAAIAARTGNPADVNTFRLPVYRNSNQVGRWTSWNFQSRRYTAAQVVNRIQTLLDLNDDELLTRQDTMGSVDLSQTRMVVFDAERIDPEQVLSFLELSRSPS